MLQRNRILISESNKEYRVCSLISSGTGQGDIYKVSSDDAVYALKLFYADEGELMRQQIQILMKRGKACPEYVHPLDILVVEDRLGYVMEYIPDTFLPGSVLCNGIDKDGYREELPFYVKISILHSLSEAIAVLYNANLAIMDLKFENLKINPEDWSIKILDVDTVVSSNDGKSLIEGTVGFMPPLTMKQKESPSKYNDSFALAVMIFISLLGSHPLMGKMGEEQQACDIETYLLAENPIYVWHPTDFRNRPTDDNQRTVDKLTKYPEIFIKAMERTFVDGLFKKEYRTDPSEWSAILKKAYESSYCCVECGEEQFFSHDKMTCCDCCGQKLVKPLVIQADKMMPLFFGVTVTTSDIWNDENSQSIIKVVSTAYTGKHGLLVESGPVKLTFGDDQSIEFQKGKIVPIFTNAIYEYQNKSFTIKEG